MYVRKVFEFLVLWSEAGRRFEDEGEWLIDAWVIDLRWLAAPAGEETSFTAACALLE